MASELIVMRKFLYFSICIVLFLGVMWGLKSFLLAVSDDFRNGFVLGVIVILVLGYSAEKLGYKEPRY